MKTKQTIHSSACKVLFTLAAILKIQMIMSLNVVHPRELE